MDERTRGAATGSRHRGRARFSLAELAERNSGGGAERGGEGLDAGSAAFYHSECYACPVGSAFAAIREVRPEAVDRLLSAVTDLAGAARAAVEVLAGETRRETRSDKVEKINLE